MNHLECSKMVGLGACPADALDAVKRNSIYVCKCNSGNGAVRELCDFVPDKKELIE